jgi:PAS domain S-box-containing protein
MTPIAGGEAAGGSGDAGGTLGGALDIFRRIFDIANVGIFQTTPEGKFLLVNDALARMLGYAGPAELIEATRGATHLHYADPKRREEMLLQLERDGRVENVLVEALKRDGDSMWISASAIALKGGDGERSYLGTAVDVTDMVRAQQGLARSVRDFQRIFDNAAEGVYRSSPDGRQLRANPALVRLNGYASEAEMLAAVNDIATEWYADPGRRDEFKRRLERDGRVVGFESEIFRHKTRERIWIAENAWIVRDREGRPLFYEGTVVDITQRKAAERALMESERRFRDFAEVSSDWFWETDAEHRLAYLSEQASASVGKRLGKTRWELAADLEEEPEKWARFREALDRREPFRDFVYRTRADDGRIRYNSVSGKPVAGPDGRFLGYRGTARDVTGVVAAEDRLRQAMHEAEEANQAKVAFLANMSHELRTPLNAILGFAEVIRDRVFGPADERYTGYAKFICESGGHLLTLINDILDMAKMDAGRLQLFDAEMDLARLLERQCALLSRRAQERGVTLEVSCAPLLPALRADEVRMRQIVLNLLSNAIKFTPTGGRIAVGAMAREDGRIAVTIADTGIGMTGDEIALALLPFRQVDADLSRRYEGTGLGLPIANSLVALHGGELLIDSEKDKGTTVTVLLPASRTAATARAE